MARKRTVSGGVGGVSVSDVRCFRYRSAELRSKPSAKRDFGVWWPIYTSIRLRSANSRTASTCSRVTPGYHSKKSLTVAPTSRFSKSKVAGTWVPLNRHIHLDLPGPRSTTVHWVQSSIAETINPLRRNTNLPPSAKPPSPMSGRRLVSRISVLPSWVESVYISSVVSPINPPINVLCIPFLFGLPPLSIL
jgi:hypothetical protein